jgi:hypothetical protein
MRSYFARTHNGLPFFQIEMPADGRHPLRTSLVVNFGTSIRGHATRSA